MFLDAFNFGQFYLFEEKSDARSVLIFLYDETCPGLGIFLNNFLGPPRPRNASPNALHLGKACGKITLGVFFVLSSSALNCTRERRHKTPRVLPRQASGLAGN